MAFFTSSVLEGCDIFCLQSFVFWRVWHFWSVLSVLWRGVAFLESVLGCDILEEALAEFWRVWHFWSVLSVLWRGVAFLESVLGCDI